MTPMLEKAMMAAIDAADGPPGDLDWPAIIRAALLAIREPSADVLDAGRYGGPITGSAPLTSAYTAMIDAILNEKPEGP